MGFLRDLVVRIKGDKTHLDTTLDGAKKSVNSFGDTLKKIGGLLGVAFGLREIVSFSKEAMKLAAEAEGVRNAFMKIGDAKSVLEDMKRATRGVMEESDLMQLAVKAQNFNIPLKDLGKYLEFATNRAITTGKSVSELTDLIVTGLGRKSSRSFIQLGLAAKDVQEAFKTSGGMMNLVTDALDKMGPVADTAATRFGRLAANVKNLKEAWGDFLNNSKLVQGAISGTSLTLQKLADPNFSFWEKMTMSGKKYLAWVKSNEATQALMQPGYNRLHGTTGTAASAPVQQIETLETLKQKLKDLDTELQTVDITDKKLTASIRDQVKALKDQISEIETGIHVFNAADMSASKGNPIKSVGTGGISMPSFGSKPVMEGLQKWDNAEMLKQIQERAAGIKQEREMTSELQQQMFVAEALNNVFDGMFSNIDKGFKGMVDGMIKSLERLAEELIAKAVVFTILKAIFPESDLVLNGIESFMGIGKNPFKSSGSKGVNVGSGLTASSGGGGKLVASISGKQIDIVYKRFLEDKS